MTILLQAGLSNALVAMLFAILVVIAVRRIKHPAWRHALWVLVLLKLVTPPIFALPLLPTAQNTPETMTAVDDVTVETPIEDGTAMVAPERGAYEQQLMQSAVVANEPSLPEMGAQTPIAVRSSFEPQPRLSPGREDLTFNGSSWPSFAAWICMIWIAGSVLRAVHVTRGLLMFRRWLGRARPAPERVIALLPEIYKRLRLSRQPQVCVVPGVVTPMVWSLGNRARLLLPEQLLRYVDDDQLSTLLAHELAHIRRRDQWVRLLEVVASVLYWWHPVVWWAQRNLRRAEEEACDAWVVWALPAKAEAYARAILTTVDFLSHDQTRLAPLATGIGDGLILKERLRSIVEANTPRTCSSIARLSIVCLAALLLPMGLISTGSQAERAEQGAGDDAGAAVRDDQPPEEADTELPAKLLGFIRLTDDGVQSWAADGSAADLPEVEWSRLNPNETVAVFRIPEEWTVWGYFLKASNMLEFPEIWRSSDDETLVLCRMDLPIGRQYGNLSMHLTRSGEREHVVPLTESDAGQFRQVDTFGIENFSGLEATGAESFRVTIGHSDDVGAEILAAVDSADRDVRPSDVQEAPSGGSTLLTFYIPLEQLAGIALTRLESDGLWYRNVALQPGVSAVPYFGQRPAGPSPDESPAQPDPDIPDDHRVQLPNGVLVELLGVGRFADGELEWWSLDGREQEAIPGVFKSDVEGYGTVIAARVDGEATSWSSEQEVDGIRRRLAASAFAHPAGIWLAHVDPSSELESGNLILSITGGPGQIVETVSLEGDADESGERRIIEEITFVKSTGPESCQISFRHGELPPGIEYVGIDQAGNQIERSAGSFGGRRATVTLPIARVGLKALAVLQRGRFEVRFDDIALQPGHATHVTRAAQALTGEVQSTTPEPAPPAAVVVTGTVTVATTGDPITDYKLIPGYDHGRGNMFFDGRNARSFGTSAFLIRIVPPNFSRPTDIVQYLRVEAPGYPARIATIDPEVTPVVIEFQLSEDDGIAGVVQSADGTPLPDAQVVACLTTRWTQINENRVRPDNSNTVAVMPDATGRFMVSSDDPAFAVLAIHQSGYGLVSLRDLSEHGRLVIAPWASVAGVFKIGDQPAANQTIELNFEPVPENVGDSSDTILLSYETETDGQGRFEFPRVPGFEGRIGRQFVLRRSGTGTMSTFAPAKNIRVEPGEALSYDFGGQGRAITGRLVAPESYTEPIDFDWTSGSIWLQQETPYPPGLTYEEQRRWYEEWKNQPEGRAHWLEAHSHGFKADADGSFRVDDLPPGTYQLIVRVEHPQAEGEFASSRDLGVYSSEITVTAGDADEVIDLGSLELNIVDSADE